MDLLRRAAFTQGFMFRSLVVLILLSSAGLAAQQSSLTENRFLETREGLEALLREMEQTASSSAYSDALRRRARAEADMLRARLEFGDFRTRDRIFVALSVRGQPVFADTVEVAQGPMVFLQSETLELPGIDLTGVLRSEVQRHLQDNAARYLQEPSVDQVNSFIRLTVSGSATAQGQTYLPATADIGSAVTQAGLSPASDVDRVSIRRGDEVLWDQESVAEAWREGRTLDQMSLQAGDEIAIPQRPTGGGWATIIQVGVGVLGTLALVLQVF